MKQKYHMFSSISLKQLKLTVQQSKEKTQKKSMFLVKCINYQLLKKVILFYFFE